MSVEEKQKFLLLGLDGLDWQLLNPLIQSGHLKGFSQLIESGSSGNLQTLTPTLSPMLWNAIATGKRAHLHGVHGFTEVHPKSGSIVPASSLSRKCKAVWNILQQSGYRSHVINWFASHPAEPLSGSMISDRFPEGAVPVDKPWPLNPDSISRGEWKEKLSELRVSPDEIDPAIIQLFVPQADKVDQSSDKRLSTLGNELAKAYTVHQSTSWILENQDWDFVAAYWRTPDLLFHHFMPFHPPAVPGTPDILADVYKEVVNGVLVYFDFFLQYYLKIIPENTNVILLSDHGFQSGNLRPEYDSNPFKSPEAWHRKQGVLITSGPAFRNGAEPFGARLTDITPTLLHIAKLPIGSDMNGRVLMELLHEPDTVSTIPSWENVNGDTGKHDPNKEMANEDSSSLVQTFVELGYIDPIDTDISVAAKNTIRNNQYNLALDLLDSGLPDKAAPILKHLHSEDPYEPELILSLADAYRSLEFIPEAKEVLNFLPESLKARPKVTIFKAMIAMDEERYEDASKLIDSIHEAGHKSIDLALLLGKIYSSLNKLSAAEDQFQSVLRKDPDNAYAHQGIAYLLFRQRQFQDATYSAMKAIELMHDLPRVHFILARCLVRLGRTSEAKDALKLALHYNPSLNIARRLLIKLHITDGEHTIASQYREELELFLKTKKSRPERVHDLKTELQKIEKPSAISDHFTNLPDDHPVITIVSGLPRSGTSLMMQILTKLGTDALTDEVRSADKNNVKGYFEWEKIKELRRHPEYVLEAQGKAVKVISMLLRFLPKGLNYKLIFMERNTDAIAASQLRMLGRETGDLYEKEKKSLKGQILRHKTEMDKVLASLKKDTVLRIDFDNLLNYPDDELESLREFLNIDEQNLDSARSCIDLSLKHH